MAQQSFSYAVRQAIWEAHNKRCGYCRDPLTFADLEIDHIVPEMLKNASTTRRKEIFETHGISNSFDFLGFGNLMASCSMCNSKKGDQLLEAGALSIHLAIATREIPTVDRLIKKFQKADQLDKLRFAIAIALESGSLSTSEIPNLLSSARAKNGLFKLTAPYPIFGEAPLRELSREKYEEYLDSALVLPEFMSDGLRLVNDSDHEIHVRSLREYRTATTGGYYPLSNVEMKTAYSLFVRPLGVLDLLLKARLAERSFIDDPQRGLPDIGLLPATLLFGTSDMYEEDPLPEPLNKKIETIADLVERGEARIVKVGSDLLSVEYQDNWTWMFDLMRADVNEDGIQELVINWNGGPLTGSLMAGAVIVLARNSETGIFTKVDDLV